MNRVRAWAGSYRDSGAVRRGDDRQAEQRHLLGTLRRADLAVPFRVEELGFDEVPGERFQPVRVDAAAVRR